jgi:protein TonB
MIHGIDAYFLERQRFSRRLAGTIMGVAMGVLSASLTLIIIGRDPRGQALLRKVPLSDWGYEGAEQYVRRIELKSEAGAPERSSGQIAQYVPAARRGGSPSRARVQHPNAPPEFRPPRDDEGDAEEDRLARRRAQLLNVPLVQSENLVIDHLVKPSYPEEARDRGIEGRVAVLALVDTSGIVTDVEVVGTGSSELLEHAAQEAVLKCRFRPYRVDGHTQSVYAMFRFSFRMY